MGIVSTATPYSTTSTVRIPTNHHGTSGISLPSHTYGNQVIASSSSSSTTNNNTYGSSVPFLPSGRSSIPINPSNSSTNTPSSSNSGPSLPSLLPGTINFSPMPGILPEVVFTPVMHIEIRIGETTVRALLPILPNQSDTSNNNTPSPNPALSSGGGITPLPFPPGTNCWIKVHDINRTNQGKIFIVAKATLAKDGQWYYVLQDQEKQSNPSNGMYPNYNPSSEYVLRAVKREEKTRIVTAQAKLSAGEHCDNSILERALLLHLQQLRTRSSQLSNTIVDTTGTNNNHFLHPPSYRLEECWHDELYLYSLTDYVPNGDLFQYCANLAIRGQTISESILRTIIKDVLLSLRILHQQGFTHRDVSPENILLIDNYYSPLPSSTSSPNTSTAIPGTISSLSSSSSYLVSPSVRTYRGVLIDYGSALPMPPDPSSSTVAFTGISLRSTSIGSPSLSDTAIDTSTGRNTPTNSIMNNNNNTNSSNSRNNGMEQDHNNNSTLLSANTANITLSSSSSSTTQEMNDTVLSPNVLKRSNSSKRSSSFFRLKRSVSNNSDSSNGMHDQEFSTTSLLLSPSTTNHSTMSTQTSLSSNFSNSTHTMGRGGWLPLSSPKGSPFCKPSYACPYYIWGKKWYGIAYDLYSVGATLYTAMNGKPFYTIPNIHDSHFQILLEAERKFSRSLVVMNQQTLQSNYFPSQSTNPPPPHPGPRSRTSSIGGNMSQQSTSNMSITMKDDQDITMGMDNLHMHATTGTTHVAKRQSSSSFSSKKKHRSSTTNQLSSSSTTTEYLPEEEDTLMEDNTLLTNSSVNPSFLSSPSSGSSPSSVITTTTTNAMNPVLNASYQPQTSMAIHLPPPPNIGMATTPSLTHTREYMASSTSASSSSSYTNSIHITPTSIIYNTVDANYTDTFLEYLKLQNRYERINRGKVPLSPLLCDLIAKLLRITPTYRPMDVDTVLAHPWFDEKD